MENIVRYHRAKITASLVSVGQMKRLVNSSIGSMLMVVREKYAETYDAFQGFDPTHKNISCEIFSNYDGIFQEPSGLPPKCEIQHEIHL